MPKHFKKISEEVIHKNPWWEYKHDVYKLSGGTEADYYYFESRGTAIIIPILDDGRLVLVSQFRYLRERQSIEFPMGALDKDEAAQAGAARELLEETGYESSSFVKVGNFDISPGMIKSAAHLFVADELVKKNEQKLDKTEDIEVLYRRPDEFEDMIKRGEIWDGLTLSAWAMVRDRVMKRIYGQN